MIDPHRVLGVQPGATAAEIKRAYRRLAKEFHPDAAGEDAVPAFLAIQAAYEALIDERGARRASPRGDPWAADPERARAARDAWAARARANHATRPGARGSGRAGGGGSAGTSAGASGPAPGSTGPQEARRGRSGERARRTARPGSTSYDDADHDPGHPEWSGASWYGHTSGTYWTINPREYADPRKHGPEYQARARRRSWKPGEADPADPAEAPSGTADAGADSADATDAADATADPGRRADAEAPPRFRARATETGASGRAWTSDFAPPPPPRWHGPPPRAASGSPPPSLLGLVAAASYRPSGRFLLALVGWVPVGIALAFGIGEATGCGHFSAACNGPFDLVGLAVQAGIVAILLLVRRLAIVATIAAISMLAIALPVTLALSALGGGRGPGESGAVLAVFLAVGWLVGIGIAVAKRPDRWPDPEGRPVP